MDMGLLGWQHPQVMPHTFSASPQVPFTETVTALHSRKASSQRRKPRLICGLAPSSLLFSAAQTS